MSKRSGMLLAFLLVLLALPVGAQTSMTARDLQQRSIDSTRVDGTEFNSKLIIINQDGERRIRSMVSVSKLYEDGKLEKKMVRFTEPADVKGTGFLSYDYNDRDDEKWIYMPALRKTRRIVSSENAKSFMGSEFSYADMSLPTIDDFTYRFLGDEVVNGEPCYALEILPKNADVEEENGFSKKVSYISKNDFVQRRSVYYDRGGEKGKVLEVKSVIEVDPEKRRYRMGEIEITNIRNNRKSISIVEKIKFNPDIPDGYFSTRYLEK